MSHKNEKTQIVEKNTNIKEFIKYLDHTLTILENRVAEEDFEKKDSDVYKLFTTLFNIYGTVPNDLYANSKRIIDKKEHTIANNYLKKNQQKMNLPNPSQGNNLRDDLKKIFRTEIDMSSIISQHIANKKKLQKNPKWEDGPCLVQSDKHAMDMYKKSLNEFRTSDDGPIIFTEDNGWDINFGNVDYSSNLCDTTTFEKKTTSIPIPTHKPKKVVQFPKQDAVNDKKNSHKKITVKNDEYEKTDAIDEKIDNLKKLLEKYNDK